MKTKRIFYTILVSLAVLFIACEPQKEVAPDLGALPSGDFTVDATDANNVVFTAPAGYLYNWDFGTGEISNTQTAKVYFPFRGEYNVTLLLSGKAGVSELTKNVSIVTNDPAVGAQPLLKELTDGGLGKTWVYASDRPSIAPFPAGAYLFMVANYDWTEFWWNPYDASPPPGINNEMRFDLDGGYNYTFYTDASATGETGSFVIDLENKIIQIHNPYIPDYDEDNCDPNVTQAGKYEIKSLTDDELILYQDQTTVNPGSFDYGWVWIFKRKGYIYSK